MSRKPSVADAILAMTDRELAAFTAGIAFGLKAVETPYVLALLAPWLPETDR